MYYKKNMNREIILDIETTGLDFKLGDKIIEIACVEMINKVLTGKVFHSYLNTDKEINKKAFEIHGISKAFINNKPTFKKVSKNLLKFIGQSNIVAHNACFDIGFINNELQDMGLESISINRIIDTLRISKDKFPNSLVNLNNLCRKFGINVNSREKHGALIDAMLLSKVYSKLSLIKSKSVSLFMKKRENDIIYRFFIPNKMKRMQIIKNEILLHNNLVEHICNASVTQ